MNELACRHFLIGHSIWYDARNRGAEFGVARIVACIHPADGDGFPVNIDRLFAFTQLFGPTGAIMFRIRLVRIESMGFDEEQEIEPVEYGPWDAEITDLDWVNSFGFILEEVPFREPGLYEFQLWIDGAEEPVARERVLAQE